MLRYVFIMTMLISITYLWDKLKSSGCSYQSLQHHGTCWASMGFLKFSRHHIIRTTHSFYDCEMLVRILLSVLFLSVSDTVGVSLCFAVVLFSAVVVTHLSIDVGN